MCPAWYYLTGIVALAGARTRSKEFEVRAKAAREAPLDRNVEKTIVFEGFSMRARADFFKFSGRENRMFSYVLLKSDLEIVENTLCLCKGLWPWQARERDRRSSRCARKLPAKPV